MFTDSSAAEMTTNQLVCSLHSTGSPREVCSVKRDMLIVNDEFGCEKSGTVCFKYCTDICLKELKNIMKNIRIAVPQLVFELGTF
jgi:hypothetical protein